MDKFNLLLKYIERGYLLEYGLGLAVQERKLGYITSAGQNELISILLNMNGLSKENYNKIYRSFFEYVKNILYEYRKIPTFHDLRSKEILEVDKINRILGKLVEREYTPAIDLMMELSKQNISPDETRPFPFDEKTRMNYYKNKIKDGGFDMVEDILNYMENFSFRKQAGINSELLIEIIEIYAGGSDATYVKDKQHVYDRIFEIASKGFYVDKRGIFRISNGTLDVFELLLRYGYSFDKIKKSFEAVKNSFRDQIEKSSVYRKGFLKKINTIIESYKERGA